MTTDWKEIRLHNDRFFISQADTGFTVKWETPCGTWLQKSAPLSLLEETLGDANLDDLDSCWCAGRIAIEEDDIPAQLSTPPECITIN